MNNNTLDIRILYYYYYYFDKILMYKIFELTNHKYINFPKMYVLLQLLQFFKHG